MRKMILALVVVMLAAPAWSAVTITLVDEGNNVVAVNYDSTAETELVRAFALDITLSNGTITDVTDFAVGDDNGGYGIFPANFSRFITVDGQTGEVADWGVAGYTPVADANDTGAAGALGTGAITIEMGSLYDQMAPGKTGTLCKLVYEGDGDLCVAANAVRGGIVLENAASADLVSDCITVGEEVPCVPADQVADWELLGKPDCWCSAYQCDGDIDGKDSGGLAKFQVSAGDLNILVENWQRKANNPDLDPCADVDHKDSGGLAKFRVSAADLNILVANWQKKASQLPGDCPR